MNEVIVEKLAQKVVNLLDEVSEVNILIRRLPHTHETINRINERIDAIYTAITQIEEKLITDDQLLNALEEQTKLLNESKEMEATFLKESKEMEATFLQECMKEWKKETYAQGAAVRSVKDYLLDTVKSVEKMSEIMPGLKTTMTEEFKTQKTAVFLLAMGLALCIIILLFRH